METINEKEFTIKEVFSGLNIEDYYERVCNSNSRGEMFHLLDYANIYNTIHDYPPLKDSFRDWFMYIVDFAEKNWSRPESIFQHIAKIYFDELKSLKKE